MTKAEEIHRRIDELVASGVKKADAFRQLAEETGQPAKSLQGAYYTFSREGSGGSNRSRKRETTTADAVAQASGVLEKALGDIDTEIAAAKERADEARAEHEALKASASERKQAIEAKLAALRS
jgi:hypothetical protein